MSYHLIRAPECAWTWTITCLRKLNQIHLCFLKLPIQNKTNDLIKFSGQQVYKLPIFAKQLTMKEKERQLKTSNKKKV